MEIEKKFLIKALPSDYTTFKSTTISQGYIATEPVIRIRQRDHQYFLTVKSKGLLAREEFEIEIQKENYEHLLKKVDYNMVEKTRYIIPYNDYTIELDVFKEQLKGLIMAEVEFTSIEEAHAFTPPEWFAKEVTNDYRYHNSNLCQLERFE